MDASGLCSDRVSLEGVASVSASGDSEWAGASHPSASWESLCEPQHSDAASHTLFLARVFLFSVRSMECLRLSSSRVHLRVLQRSGRGSERSVETERGDQLVSKCATVSAERDRPRELRPLGASLSPRSPSLPAAHLAVVCVGRPRLASRTGLGASRQVHACASLAATSPLGLGAALSDQLSVVGTTNTFGPVKSLLTFPSSATTKPSSEVRSRTRLQVPHQQRRLGNQKRRSTPVCVSSPDHGNKDIGLKRRCWRWSPRPWSAR